MGDMADMALSETMDMEDLRLDYRMGHMSYQDAYDHGIIDELGFENSYGHTRTLIKTCKYCLAKGLHWINTGNGWRLSDHSGHIHCCEKYKPKEPR